MHPSPASGEGGCRWIRDACGAPKDEFVRQGSQNPVSDVDQGKRSQALIKSYREIEKKDWWIWGNTILIIVLLTGTVWILALPRLRENARTLFHISLQDAVLALALLVMFFNIYTVYQQVLIKRLRRQLLEGQGHSEILRNLALIDPLTGLYNRRFAEQRLAAEVARSSRRGHRLSVLALDLNKFKEINDTYGHMAGDLVLQEFGARLNSAVRTSDLAVRTGGDEFLVILPDCQGEEVERILARLKDIEVVSNGRRIPVEYSAGWREYKAGDRAEDLLAGSDEALYANKRAAGEKLRNSRREKPAG